MLAILIINSGIVAAAVLIHYEVLRRMNEIIPGLQVRNRIRVLFGLVGCLFAHVAEIWLFAAGYYALIAMNGFGTLEGNFQYTLLDCAYFSFTTYTSLGYGDIAPWGDLRFLAGLEALTGLMMITWSASFMFLEMQRFWRKSD